MKTDLKKVQNLIRVLTPKTNKKSLLNALKEWEIWYKKAKDIILNTS